MVGLVAVKLFLSTISFLLFRANHYMSSRSHPGQPIVKKKTISPMAIQSKRVFSHWTMIFSMSQPSRSLYDKSSNVPSIPYGPRSNQVSIDSYYTGALCQSEPRLNQMLLHSSIMVGARGANPLLTLSKTLHSYSADWDKDDSKSYNAKISFFSKR